MDIDEELLLQHLKMDSQEYITTHIQEGHLIVDELLLIGDQMSHIRDEEDDEVWYYFSAFENKEDHELEMTSDVQFTEQETNLGKRPNVATCVMIIDLFASANEVMFLPRRQLTTIQQKYGVNKSTLAKLWRLQKIIK